MTRLGAALAIARAARWERRNTLWRFSPLKAGAWFLLFRAALTGTALYNSFRNGTALPLPLALTLVGAASALWGVFSAYLNDRDRLYRSRLAELIHISPAPGYSLLLGNLLADVPSRAATGLLWAAMFASPADGGWWQLPILWGASVVASLLAQLAATLVLLAAVRRWPGFLVWTWALALAGVLALVGLAAYVLLRPELLQEAARLHLPSAPPLATLLFAGGACVGAWVALRPEGLGNLYRESWVRVSENARSSGRRRGSYWPALHRGTAGAIQAKDWLVMGRHPLTWLRLGVIAAGIVGLIVLKPWLASSPLETRQWAAPAVAYGAAVFILGEVIVTLLPGEREKLTWLAISGSFAGRVLLGKAFAALPAVLLTSGFYGLAGWAFGLDAGTPELLWQGFLAGTGMVAILLGAGALDASRPVAALPVDETYQQLFEQVPMGFASQAGLLVAAGFGAAQVWGAPPLAAAAWLVPLLICAAGWLRLARFLSAGRNS